MCAGFVLATVLRGFNLLELFCWGSEIDGRREFREEDFRMISEFGFNFVRLPMDYRFWTHGGDWNEIDEDALRPVDRAIEYGRRHKIHVQVCFHRAPGYCVNATAKEPADLFRDEEAQRVCERHWRVFARRYRGVPAQRLSFNLVNEPPRMRSEEYACVAARLIRAIHEEDPLRPVWSDGIDGGVHPAPELVGLKNVGQSLHVYKPHGLTHYRAPWAGCPSVSPVWPMPADAPIGVLTGPGKPDMRGVFSVDGLPAGTRVRLRFERVSGRVTVEMRSDGRPVRQETLDPKDGSPGWTRVRHYPQWGLSQGSYTNAIEVVLEAPSGRFEIEAVKGDWAELACIELVGPNKEVAVLPVSIAWRTPERSRQRFLGWSGGERHFDSIEPLPRKYADDAREWLYRNVFAEWDDLSGRDGFLSMVGELGVYHETPHALTLAWLRDVLSMCRERNVGWALWNFRGRFGVLDSERADVQYEDYQGHKLDRKLLEVLQDSIEPVDLADPFVGTRGKASCTPAASVPFGMVKPGPSTRTETWETTGGYSSDDRTLRGFVQTSLCGGGCPDLGDLLIHPISGDLCEGDWRSSIDRENECAEPGYYAVELPGFGVFCEITATERVAFYRFTYRRKGKKHLLIDTQYGNCFPGHVAKRVLDEDIRLVDARTVTGSQTVNGGWAKRTFHWRLETDVPASSTERRPPLSTGKGERLFRSFDLPADGTVLVKIAFSHESADGARANLAAELPGWDFSAVRLQARAKWSNRFAHVKAKGGTAENRRKFYTALYRSLLSPDLASDAGKPMRFSSLSLWDTYRAQQPLLTEIAPETVPGVVNTLLDGYDRQGFLPVWAHWGGDTQTMVGSHAVPVIVDAYLKGFEGVDWRKAYRAVRDTLTGHHPNRHKEDWELLDRYGYFPCDLVKGESVSRTLECAYDDACAARFAEALGKTDDAAFFVRRASSWTNVFDRSIGFMRGRDTRGNWRKPFDPHVCGQGGDSPNDFTEGNAFAYTFHVQHDLPRLALLMGGVSNLLAGVDAVFATPGEMKGWGWMDYFERAIGQYAHGNEQLHHLPFVYAAFGEPARTSARVREICDRLYDADRDGYPGNEDLGQMSAWFVFAAAGRYPVDPCGRGYVRFRSPIFDSVEFVREREMQYGSLHSPDEVLVDGAASGDRVRVEPNGAVVLNGGVASTVCLRWKRRLGRGVRLFGGNWERTYGASGWRRMIEGDQTGRQGMAWYFLVEDGFRCDGYGVAVQPKAFASWRARPDGMDLVLDVRAGSAPVRLGSRKLELCRLVSRRGKGDESAFEAGRAFMRMMCPASRPVEGAVFGYNDWYCAYGKNTAEDFLLDGQALIGAMGKGGSARPFFIVDDGWQNSRWRGGDESRGGQWSAVNSRWGMPMDEFVRRVRALGARPGLWYRPFVPNAANWKELESGLPVDPSDADWKGRIRRDMGTFAAWGIEAVKIDFLVYDWTKRWELGENESPVPDDLPTWKDCSRTTAEVVSELYRMMREAAGENMVIIGCNALDHFAAGLFELQRTGDDTSGREWSRTRKMGPNTLAMRAMHEGAFYRVDADCVGLAGEGLVPWEKNRQWLRLVSRSGTALFTSWKRNLLTDEIAGEIGEAWRKASAHGVLAEPLDWLETVEPRVWRFQNGGTEVFDW